MLPLTPQPPPFPVCGSLHSTDDNTAEHLADLEVWVLW